MVQEVFVNAERMAAGSQADVLWLGEARDRFPRAAPRRAAPGVGPDARQAAHRQDGRLHERDADARRRLQRGRHLARPQAHRARGLDRSRPPTTTPRCRGRASTSARRSTTASSPSSTSPATCRSPAATASGRRSSTRSATSSTPSTAAPSASSPRAARPRPRPRPCARRLPHLTTLAQGDAQLPELAKQFVEDPHTCLFGTLSLWQGLDVPGETCQLVIIDRIPFPRPDDPLMSARAEGGRRVRRQRLHGGRPPPTPRCCSPRAPAG